MEAKHTPGLLSHDGPFVTGVGRCDAIDGPVHGIIAECCDTDKQDDDGREWTCGGNKRDNARRFVAAWNACDGIETEALEAGVVLEIARMLVAAIDYCEQIIFAEMEPCHASLMALAGLEPFKETLRRSGLKIDIAPSKIEGH